MNRLKTWPALLPARLPALLTALLLSAPVQAEVRPSWQTLDDMTDAAAWTASASDQVRAALRRDADGSLCLDHDFAGVSGYAVMRRELPLDWPSHFDLQLRLKGRGDGNDLQLKLVDASGDNVWWMTRPGYAPPTTLSLMKLRQRHFSFAWGPATDRRLQRTQAIELVVAAGQRGGAGQVCLAQISRRARAPDPAVWPAPVLRRHANGLDWDFGVVREFNGVALQWPADAKARDFRHYQLLASDDGRQWRRLRQLRGGDGGLDTLFLPESEARFLRLAAASQAGSKAPAARRDAGAALAPAPASTPTPTLTLRSAADWPDANAVLASAAAALPRGDLPRAFLGEQNYWTLVGVDGGGGRSGLLSEDGALELGRRGPSVEPAVRLADGRWLRWSDVQTRHRLRDGELPLPQVRWQHPELQLDIEAAADGPPDAPELLARYHLHNPGPAPQRVTLLLALRPWQVNPPQQFLSTPGGISPLRQLTATPGALQADARAALRFSQPPSQLRALPFDSGLSLQRLHQAPLLSPRSPLTDPQGLASAAALFDIELAPGETRSLGWSAALAAGQRTAALSPASLDARFEAAAATWRQRLGGLQLQLPPSAQPLAQGLRAALAQILMSRDGPALQPGTRSYARSWVRDGAMMVAGLLRLGEVQAAREFIDWYRGQVFASGKVPCCVDQRGADPVVENDSHGQYLFAVAEVWRHTGDRDFLARHASTVQRVWAWMEALRQSERGAANRTPARAHLFGLMPPSISHEGYADKPAYAYWDNFWALRGYKDAVQIAQALGWPTEAWAAARDEYAAELQASIRASAAHHGVAFIPGAADRGDFDPTSTTMALNPAQAAVPHELLAATFERYWQDAQARDRGHKPWKDYTPYELRNISALVHLGQVERAHTMLDFFLRHQRPAGWQQWAEVVLPDAREPRFLGDMPHAWISSDYIRALLDLLVIEHEADDSLLLGAGLRPAWREEGDIALAGLSTARGRLGFRLLRRAGGWALHLDQAPADLGGGLRLAWPGSDALPRASHQGQPLAWQGRELKLPPAPATVLLDRP